jgi:hypothetical protein
MAHDLTHAKVSVFLYDKLFKKEVSDGIPIHNMNNLSVFSQKSLKRNNQLLIISERSAIVNGGVSLDAHKTYILKNMDMCKHKAYLLNYNLKQTDLPVADALTKEKYRLLWGNPPVMEEIIKYNSRGVSTTNRSQYYRKDLFKITQKILKKSNDHSIDNLVKIIEADYPIKAELLLNYIKKFEHLMK